MPEATSSSQQFVVPRLDEIPSSHTCVLTRAHRSNVTAKNRALGAQKSVWNALIRTTFVAGMSCYSANETTWSALVLTVSQNSLNQACPEPGGPNEHNGNLH